MRYFLIFALIFASSTFAANQEDLSKNQKAQTVCDNNRMHFEKENFQNLYKKDLYEQAYQQLKSYTEQCQKTIEPMKLLWLQNDLALAIQKAGNPQQCQSILADVKKNPDFLRASKTLKDAVDFNYKRCGSELVTLGKLDKPKGDKEYAWLLDTKLFEDQKSILFAKMLPQIIPNDTPKIQFTNDFKAALTTRLQHPPLIKDGRYGIASGSLANDSTCRAIVWLDIKTGTSIVGLINKGDGFIVLTSKFYNLDTYPMKAKQDIKKLSLDILAEWGEEPTTKHVCIYDAGSKQGSVVPFLWFNKTFNYLSSSI